MVLTTPIECYGADSSAYCDECRNEVGAYTQVYHCTRGKCAEHESGYDYCMTCSLRRSNLNAVTSQDSSRLPAGVVEQMVYALDRRALLGAGSTEFTITNDNAGNDNDNNNGDVDMITITDTSSSATMTTRAATTKHKEEKKREGEAGGEDSNKSVSIVSKKKALFVAGSDDHMYYSMLQIENEIEAAMRRGKEENADAIKALMKEFAIWMAKIDDS